jgi:hypothetical protein
MVYKARQLVVARQTLRWKFPKKYANAWQLAPSVVPQILAKVPAHAPSYGPFKWQDSLRFGFTFKSLQFFSKGQGEKVGDELLTAWEMCCTLLQVGTVLLNHRGGGGPLPVLRLSESEPLRRVNAPGGIFLYLFTESKIV